MGRYIPSTGAEQQEMLRSIGLDDFRQLYKDVPEQMYLERGLDIPAGMSELEAAREMSAMAAENKVFPTVLRGAGAYDHYIPSIVKYIPAKEEFLTAYTPYQAEPSFTPSLTNRAYILSVSSRCTAQCSSGFTGIIILSVFA